MQIKTGRLIGVGTGPGDPELLTLKAVRALQEADVVTYFAKRGSNGNARGIVGPHYRETWIELPLVYPVTTEIHKDSRDYREAILGFYEESVHKVEEHLEKGRTVAVLSEGDPLFYGSYMHLHVRLCDRWPTEVIPGVTAMSGCWSQTGTPIVQGDDILTVLPGTLYRRGCHHEGRAQPAEDQEGARVDRTARQGDLCRTRHDDEHSVRAAG
jgi:precorrin-2/cobalt-factor-2 C20-methyltransferase